MTIVDKITTLDPAAPAAMTRLVAWLEWAGWSMRVDVDYKADGRRVLTVNGLSADTEHGVRSMWIGETPNSKGRHAGTSMRQNSEPWRGVGISVACRKIEELTRG